MFDNFLINLCKSENLIDVGKDGKTSQSSLSQWSKENDSQRAVNGENFADFAFHTNKEQNPWWQIEWEYPTLLKYIIINNRKRKPFDERAIPLKVSIINDKNQEIVVYNGKLLFGSLPESMPLILPLQGHYLVKRIKVELQDFYYLHLCNIYCLRKKSMQEEKGKLIFFANRDDGLGERLRALLNAMYHADKYNGEFYFGWNDFKRSHFCMDKSIFSKNFLQSYFLEKPEINNNLNIIEISKINYLEFDKLKQYDLIQVEQSRGNNYFGFWNKVGFNDKISEIRDRVFSLEFKNDMVAIHLRTADIVYGEWRQTELFYYKTQPIYIVEDLIIIFKKMGYNIILFSLEEELNDFLSKKYDILIPEYFLDDNYSEVDRAFFEMFLMSRCNKIISGESGFSILPSLVSDIRLESYHDYLSKAEIFSAFKKYLSNGGLLLNELINDRLKAFTISHFLNEFYDDTSVILRLKLINNIVQLDSDNVYYKFMHSVILYDNKNNQEADNILIDLLMKESHDFKILVKEFFWRKYTTLSRHIKSFKDASQSGSFIATAMVLINDFYFYKKVDVAHYQSIIDKAKSDNPNALGLDLLERKLLEFSDKGNK